MLQRIPVNSVKTTDKPQTGRKYAQITYLMKDMYSEYIENSQESQ